MQRGDVDLVIVGTDRTTYTGDVANKIGTYLKALAAKDNGVPFYVALPSSSFDWQMRDGLSEIPIEERGRGGSETRRRMGERPARSNVRLTPENSPAANYGFDITPRRLVTGLNHRARNLRSERAEHPLTFSGARFLNETGVIKFQCEHLAAELTPFSAFAELKMVRQKMRDLELVGVDDHGIGFGNVSVRERCDKLILHYRIGDWRPSRLDSERLRQSHRLGFRS